NMFISNRIICLVLGLFLASSCEEDLTKMNKNPNGLDPATVNPNMLLPAVLVPAAQSYVDLGFNDLAGAVQHTQKNGWYGGHNLYEWESRDWTGWYDMLLTNELMIQRGEELGFDFFVGVGHIMKGFAYGNITDLWGDAPYSNALKGDEEQEQFQYPRFDSQEAIYDAVINHLQQAAQIFSAGSKEGVTSANDVYFSGDVTKWHRFANSLLLRYYMRISDKKPDVARAGIEAIYQSGTYMQTPDQDATLDYTGSSNDIWLSRNTPGSADDFQRYQACQTLIDQLVETNDPRLPVWFDSVRVQWVPDPNLPTAADNIIYAHGQALDVVTYEYDKFVQLYDDVKFTRRFNPNLASYNTGLYVGLPPGILSPDAYNGNPSPGQGRQNQHVSQLAPIYATPGSPGDILKARIISAAEVSFILAEASLKGWNVGDAETHYNNGIKNSMETWGQADGYESFMEQAEVAFDNSLEKILIQKWIASWTAATESFLDY